MDFNKNLENATSMINARINNINNNDNNVNTKKTSYDKWYDFARNITTKPEERKRAPGVKKRRPPNVDKYVDTSDEEAYDQRKKYLKAIQNNEEELKKAEPEKEKKVLNYFNINTIGQYLDDNQKPIKEKDYIQTKTILNNEKNVELANYYFKHKEDKLYVEWISRIDKVRKQELKKKQIDYLNSQKGIFNEQEQKEIQPKFMEEFLDKIYTQEELYPDAEKITLVAAPFMGKDWKDKMTEEEKFQHYKSLTSYYKSLGFEIDTEKVQSIVNKNFDYYKMVYERLFQQYLRKSTKLAIKYETNYDSTKHDEYTRKMFEIHNKYESRNNDILKDFKRSIGADYLTQKEPLILSEPKRPSEIEKFERIDLRYMKRPSILLSNDDVIIDNKDYVLKTYAKLAQSIPMKANIKKTKEIIEKKINK